MKRWDYALSVAIVIVAVVQVLLIKSVLVENYQSASEIQKQDFSIDAIVIPWAIPLIFAVCCIPGVLANKRWGYVGAAVGYLPSAAILLLGMIQDLLQGTISPISFALAPPALLIIATCLLRLGHARK